MNVAKERDEAFIDFVETGSFKKVNAYCKKYGVPMPKKQRVKAAGIYKAVQYCNSIPQDIKKFENKCIKVESEDNE